MKARIVKCPCGLMLYMAANSDVVCPLCKREIHMDDGEPCVDTLTPVRTIYKFNPLSLRYLLAEYPSGGRKVFVIKDDKEVLEVVWGKEWEEDFESRVENYVHGKPSMMWWVDPNSEEK